MLILFLSYSTLIGINFVKIIKFVFRTSIFVIMENYFSKEAYEEMLSKLFVRFPSFQNNGAGAYKPGIGNMEFFDQLAGHPHRSFKVIHVAGTNGKGSVSNMLASVLASHGLKVGLYTSPHIIDFRERIRIVQRPSDCSEPSSVMISEEDVWDFVCRWQETFDHLDMSFFEITTSMALSWFAAQKTDVVVLETGLGGRLDSTNIVTPLLSVITNIGFDHCDLLGDTIPEIAFEKAGIIKPEVPVVIGESHLEADPVFERKVLYSNLPSPKFMGNRTAIMSLLTFADKQEPGLWDRRGDILARMDLKGGYQARNLRTVLTVLDKLNGLVALDEEKVVDALVNTAERTGFKGRWDKLSDNPWIICDIGHNEHGLKYNFAQLSKMKSEGECTDLIIVYGSVADKDVDAVIHLMPSDAVYVFTQAAGKRALPADQVRDKYLSHCQETGHGAGSVHCCGTVIDAVRKAEDIAAAQIAADNASRPLIYIGGSTYVVSEALAFLQYLM